MARNPKRHLPIEDVRLIRALLAEKRRLLKQVADLSFTAIAEKFDVSPNTVKNIDTGKTWGGEK